jgi:phage gp45-like
MNYELRQGKEQRAGRMLAQAQTPQEAARIHAQEYERPGKAEANIERRERIAASVAAGQDTISTANNAPVNTQNSNTIVSNNQTTTKGNRTVQVAGSTIHTQATDGAAIARDYHQHLNTQLRNATDQEDDGVIA